MLVSLVKTFRKCCFCDHLVGGCGFENTRDERAELKGIADEIVVCLLLFAFGGIKEAFSLYE